MVSVPRESGLLLPYAFILLPRLIKSRDICLYRLFVVPSCFSLRCPQVVPFHPFPSPHLLRPHMEGQHSAAFPVSWRGDTGLAPQQGDSLGSPRSCSAALHGYQTQCPLLCPAALELRGSSQWHCGRGFSTPSCSGADRFKRFLAVPCY